MKEGFLLGENLPLDDPYVIARKFGQGPNKYPEELGEEFQSVTERYHAALTTLAIGLLQILARTLDLDENVFSDFCKHPVSLLRLLHYPPQDANASALERGTSRIYLPWVD